MVGNQVCKPRPVEHLYVDLPVHHFKLTTDRQRLILHGVFELSKDVMNNIPCPDAHLMIIERRSSGS